MLEVYIYLELYGGVILINKIDGKDLSKIDGGGVEWFGIGAGIVMLVVFISGIIEGYTNPGRCSQWV